MYIHRFAPDGKTFNIIKTYKTIEKAWDRFVFNTDYRCHCVLNPYARFKLREKDTGKLIAWLPKK